MFKQNPIQKLYPSLNFNRIQPSVYNKIEPTKRSSSLPPVETVTHKVTEPSVKNTPEPKREKHVTIEEPVTVSPKTVKQDSPIKETKSPKSESPLQKVKKAKVSRPNRSKPTPKPEPKRETPVPKKGERGLQHKYTLEQRKDMYLERLSRKSIKNAEKEVKKVNAVLDSVNNDPIKLSEKEKEIKQQLKLINYSKFFLIGSEEPTTEPETSSIVNVETTSRKESTPPRSPASSSDEGSVGSN